MAPDAPEIDEAIASSRVFISNRLTDDPDEVSNYLSERLREYRLDDSTPSPHHVTVDLVHLEDEGEDDINGFEIRIAVTEASDDFTEDDLHEWAKDTARNAHRELGDD